MAQVPAQALLGAITASGSRPTISRAQPQTLTGRTIIGCTQGQHLKMGQQRLCGTQTGAVPAGQRGACWRAKQLRVLAALKCTVSQLCRLITIQST